MTLTEFIESIRDWLNREDLTETQAMSFINMAFQSVSKTLRVSENIQIDTAILVTDRVLLPLDWQESDFIAEQGKGPILYKTRDDFYRMNNANGYYTISGRYFILGGPVNTTEGRKIEMSYFGDIPIPDDAAEANSNDWPLSRHLELMTAAVMGVASAFYMEDERALNFKALQEKLIGDANTAYLAAKASGSLLIKRRRGFR